MNMRYLLMVFVMLSALPRLALAQAGAEGALQAGAAKVDITPPASALPHSTDILRDHVYIRAIAISSGQSCAILVGADQNSIRNEMVAEIIARTTSMTRCPAENYIFTGTCTHSGGVGATLGEGGVRGPIPMVFPTSA
jgi:hypothetical protein